MAITTSQTYQEAIGLKNWHSAHMLKSYAMNKLFQSNLIDRSPTGQNFINAVTDNMKNLPEKVNIGYSGYGFSEPAVAVVGDKTIPPTTEATFKTINAKPSYHFNWWSIDTIQKDLMSMINLELYLREFLGSYLATHFNHVIVNTLGGLSTVSEITVGDDNTEFSEKLYDECQQIRGDRVGNTTPTLFMSSKTLFDIKGKQDIAANKNPLISEYQMSGQNQIEVKGSPQGTNIGQFLTTKIGMPTKFAYKTMVPIVMDDIMEDGLIAVLDPKAFAFLQKSFKNPIRYKHDAMVGGIGTEAFGLVFLALMHPIGFNFIGVKAPEAGAGKYANLTGLSYAELKAGGQFELAFEAKESRIRLIKVKIGTD